MFLLGIRRRPEHVDEGVFPWTLPLFAALDTLDFAAPVTFLVGENGSGKSTLLEGLATGMAAVALGSRDLPDDDTLAAARVLARGLVFIRRRAPRVKLFLRAEDVFGFTGRVARDMRELCDIEQAFRDELPEGSQGQRRAMGLAAGQRQALAARYGENPDARSHGESFLHLLEQRLAPHGLYFLDEPETPLSPIRVLALMAMIRDRVAEGCQFVVATHSPLLMALPGAEILSFDEGRIRPIAYDEVEHVRVTRAFLNHPDRFLDRL